MKEKTNSVDEAEWAKIRQTVRDRFPDVVQISTTQLGEWMKAASDAPPVLLDARSREEYNVSQLYHAQFAENESQALAALQSVPKDQRIVVYCSVGWRSSALAQKLKARGYSNVSNLEGSIFQWANEGRPIFKGEQQVSIVHPYDAKWGRLLKAELRQPLS